MAIFRGAGGSGDATTDATSQGIVASNAATAAAASAATASTQAANATTSASAASASASSATSSASSASSSASTATTQATNAATSASSATSSASTATTQASNASTSATNAASSASAASTSATNAASSASTATTQAALATTNGAAQVALATTQVGLATTQASNASNSATAAASSATSAAASYDSFDDRYLGAKASAPTVDNDGNALLTGAIYWNTTSNALFIWTGSVWDPAAFTASGSVTAFNTRSGAVTLTSGDVTTALGFTPGQGTVTSVSGTSPVSVATGTTTPVISMAAATTSVNGYLTSTDWTTFNSKQAALVSNTNIKTVNSTSLLGSGDVSVGVTSVTGTAPVVSSGGATPAISMAAANTTTNGYLTSTDWNTFNGKSNTNGTVTSVAALTLGTTGTDLTSTVANGTTTPVITLNVPTASASNRGALSSADWTTFNNKGSGSVTSASVVSANGFAGTVATATTTPAITLTTSITGVLKGNGTALSAATSGTDYSAGTSALGTGILKSTTTTGALTIAVAADFPTLNQNTTGSAATFTSTTQNSQFNSIGVGTAGSTTAGEIRATNNVTAFYSSDKRLKENIKDVNNPLDIVCAIGAKTFDWTDDYIKSHGGEDNYFLQKSDFGVIAQDVQAVFPQAVRTRNDGTLAVDYEKLATLSFGAIQELVKRIEILEAK